MDFVAFDIEMPSQAVFSISAIGVTVVKGGRITDRYYSLVNPETKFSKYVIDLIGITPSMVRDAPTLPQVWEELEPYFTSGDIIVSHGAHGDILTLVCALGRYGILWEGDINYLCTCDLALSQSPEFEHHSLDFLCEHFGITLEHHNAQSDSDGCAKLLLKYLENGADVEKLVKKTNAEYFLNRQNTKALSDKLKQRKKLALRELAAAKPTSFDFERQYYRFFTANSDEKLQAVIRDSLQRKETIVFGVSEEMLSELAETLDEVKLFNLLSQKKFASFEMYRLYVYAFNRVDEAPKNFCALLVSLPSFDALSKIDLKKAKAAIFDGNLSSISMINELAKQNVFGFNALALMLIQSEQTFITDPEETLKIVKRVLVYGRIKDNSAQKVCAEIISSIKKLGCFDDFIEKLSIPKKVSRFFDA